MASDHSLAVRWQLAGQGANPVTASDFLDNVLPGGSVLLVADGNPQEQIVTFGVKTDRIAEASESFVITLSPSFEGDLFITTPYGLGATGPGGTERIEASRPVALFGTTSVAGLIQNDDLAVNLITGTSATNTLTGTAGPDEIRGLAGKDTLSGQAGADVLIGGTGKDTLIGGTESDRFDFNSAAEVGLGTNRDLILDFSQAQGDKIDLSGIDSKVSVGGNQAFAFLGTASFSGNASGQLRMIDQGTTVILQGSTDSDRAAEFELEVRNFSGTFVASDFVL